LFSSEEVVSPSPIPRVLSTFRRKRVRALLMGGQACILYGAAEFTRDVDFAVAVAPENLGRLRAALRELSAEPVYFPHLSASALARGHACHFRCLAPGLKGLRIDLMSKMRGVDSFERLWTRREVIDLPAIGRISVMALPDVVRAKKTQRDKDWPMIRRLVEADMTRAPAKPGAQRVAFWFRECRTLELMRDLALRYPRLGERVAAKRPVLKAVLKGDSRRAAALLKLEEERERERDRRYWAPLKRELERWRLGRTKN
jgi:hypothetical protein